MSSTPLNPIGILCVDDSTDIVEMLRMAIGREPDMTCVGCLAEAGAVVDQLENLQPDVVLIDLTMPDADPLEVIREIRTKHPKVRPVVYSGYDDADTIGKAMDAGACGFVSKHQDLKSTLDTIRKVARDESPSLCR